MGAPDEDDEEEDAPPGLPRDAPFVMSPEGHAALAEEAGAPGAGVKRACRNTSSPSATSMETSETAITVAPRSASSCAAASQPSDVAT